MSIRVRYAPSPTGHLHIGGARTALFNFLFAKKLGGTYVLRIENTDQKRNVEEATEKFLENFKWLGLNWDEGPEKGGNHSPYTCMERLDIYQKYVNQLLSEEKAYICYCTEEELDVERQSQKNQGLNPKYSGKCKHISQSQKDQYISEGRQGVIRFKVSNDASIVFEDLIRGHMSFDVNDIGDFVIVKSDGIPVYNFAVTIDDYLMEISHVIRGEEHLSNTPRQILIYQSFGWKLPEFAHVSLILNENGKKLSKRDESIVQFIEQYREMGYLPEAINNFLVLLGWSPPVGQQEIMSLEDMINSFSLQRINKSGAIFDINKLAWLNGQYIKKSDIKYITDLSIPFLKKAGYINEDYDYEWITKLVSLFKEQLTSLSQLTELSKDFFINQVVYSDESKEFLQGEYAKSVLQSFNDKLVVLETWNAENILSIIKEVQKDTGYKGKQLMGTIRAATTGQMHGPELPYTLNLLGKEKILKRINSL
jgi:nondiscriminating glutamyl-tRNA synthetase